jgi:hypothetical protein
MTIRTPQRISDYLNQELAVSMGDLWGLSGEVAAR